MLSKKPKDIAAAKMPLENAQTKERPPKASIPIDWRIPALPTNTASQLYATGGHRGLFPLFCNFLEIQPSHARIRAVLR